MVHRFYTIRTLFLCLGCSISLLFACQTVTSGTKLDKMFEALGQKNPKVETSLSLSLNKPYTIGTISPEELSTYSYNGHNYYDANDVEGSQKVRALNRSNEARTFALSILTPLLLLIGVIIAGAKWIRGV